MNILIKFLHLFFSLSICFTQANIQFSQSSNSARGEEPTNVYYNDSEDADTTTFIINENLFDLGVSFNQLYFFTKLEYSEYPVFGIERINPHDMIHSYYLEYLGDRLNVKLGNIYSLYTRGLIINTYQDQDIDFDNSILGVELSYDLLDWMRVYSIYGSDTYEFRINPQSQLNELSFDHITGFIGSELSFFDNLILNLQYMNQELIVDEDVRISGSETGGDNFIDYHSDKTFIISDHIKENFELFYADDITKYNINSDKIGLSVQSYVFGVDVYAEYVINKYTRLDPGVVVGKELDGCSLYASLSADLFNVGITYEFKRYDNPYYIETISSAPFVYREASSVLQSRLSHLMSFVNEVGHQFDVLYPFGDSFMLNLNLSTARRIHESRASTYNYALSYDIESFDLDVYPSSGIDSAYTIINNHWVETSSHSKLEYDESPSLLDVITMDRDHFLYAYWPYRQIYVGLSGYLFDDKLDFTVGYDFFDHIKEWGAGNESGITFNYYNYDYESIEESIHDAISDYWIGIDAEYDGYMENLQPLIDIGYYTQEEAEAVALGSLSYPLDEINDVVIETYTDLYMDTASDSLENYISNYQNNSKWLYTRESAVTVPTKFGWNLGKGNSILLSFERQWREVEYNKDVTYNTSDNYNDVTVSKIERFDETYLSLSLKRKNITLSLFSNNEKFKRIKYGNDDLKEIIDKEAEEDWNGVQLTFNIKENKSQILDSILSNSKLSIFYGSQKGGLVCANGVCAMQPQFIDGIKLSFSRIF